MKPNNNNEIIKMKPNNNNETITMTTQQCYNMHVACKHVDLCLRRWAKAAAAGNAWESHHDINYRKLQKSKSSG
jgi:hypothetical protein